MNEHYNRKTQKQIAMENQSSIESLTSEITILKAQLSSTSDDVKRILFYFNSDSATKQEGLIEKVNRIDNEGKDMRGKYNEIKFAAGVISVLVGMVFSLIKWVFDK